MPSKQPSDFLALVTLLAIVVICVAGYLAFPRIQAWVAYEDCTGTGRTDCIPKSTQ